jgi:acetone carboxylase alpha subunit
MASSEVEETLSSDDQAVLDQFVSENKLFYGPDPEIMNDHSLAPRTEAEERILSGGFDTQLANIVRGRVQSALDESHTMVEQMGVAPGAKWGDLVTSVSTSCGDLALCGTRGIVVFASVCQNAF